MEILKIGYGCSLEKVLGDEVHKPFEISIKTSNVIEYI